MTRLAVVLLLAACGAEERPSEADAGVVLPSSCETNAGCPAGYYCQKANAIHGSPAADKCMRPCVDLATADCSLPSCDFRADAPTFRPEPVLRLCRANGEIVEAIEIKARCTGGYIENATRSELRPWHSNDSPCETWLNRPAVWPYRF